MASVSPSPTVSMLRLTRASRCSFLFSLSMATVSSSPGAGFNTFPPHSTWRTKDTKFGWVACLNIQCKYVSMRRPLRCPRRWFPLSSTTAETSRSSCRSWLCLHRWRQSRMFQPGRQTGDHLKVKGTEVKIYLSISIPTYIKNLHYNTLSVSSIPTAG